MSREESEFGLNFRETENDFVIYDWIEDVTIHEDKFCNPLPSDYELTSFEPEEISDEDNHYTTLDYENGNALLDNKSSSFKPEVNGDEDIGNTPEDYKTNSNEPKEILPSEIYEPSPATLALEQSHLPLPDIYSLVAPSTRFILATLKNYFLQIFLKIWEAIYAFFIPIMSLLEFDRNRKQPLSFPSPSSPAYFVRAASPQDYFRKDIIITEPIIFPPTPRPPPDYFRRFYQGIFRESTLITDTFTDFNDFL